MKNLRLPFAALLLALTLTASALAGEMPTVGAASPSPPCADGEMPTVGLIAPVTEAVLTTIESLLSII